MTDEQVAKLIEKEFSEKTLAATEQYLEIHEPVCENGRIKVDRINRELSTGVIIAYIPVKEEHFFFAVYIDVEKKEILSMAPNHEIKFA